MNESPLSLKDAEAGLRKVAFVKASVSQGSSARGIHAVDTMLSHTVSPPVSDASALNALTAAFQSTHLRIADLSKRMDDMSSLMDTCRTTFQQTSSTPQSSPNRPYCTLCSTYGHTARRCYSRNRGFRENSRSAGPAEPARRDARSGRSIRPYQNQRGVRCSYCNGARHTINECYKKFWDEHHRGAQNLRPAQNSWVPKTQQTPAAQGSQDARTDAHAQPAAADAGVLAVYSGARDVIVKSSCEVGTYSRTVLWDSCASVSIIDHTFAETLLSQKLAAGSLRWPLGPNVKLKAAHRVHMPSSEPIDVRFRVQGVEFFETFIPVHNLGVSLILCPDCMVIHGVMIDLNTLRLRIPSYGIDMPDISELSDATAHCRSLLYPSVPVTIPACSHVNLTLVHDDSDPLASVTRTLYVDNRSHNLATRSLRVTPGIQQAVAGAVPLICVTNFSSSPLHLDRATAVADALPVTHEFFAGGSRCEVDNTVNYFYDSTAPFDQALEPEADWPVHFEPSSTLSKDNPSLYESSSSHGAGLKCFDLHEFDTGSERSSEPKPARAKGGSFSALESKDVNFWLVTVQPQPPGK